MSRGQNGEHRLRARRPAERRSKGQTTEGKPGCLLETIRDDERRFGRWTSTRFHEEHERGPAFVRSRVPRAVSGPRDPPPHLCPRSTRTLWSTLLGKVSGVWGSGCLGGAPGTSGPLSSPLLWSSLAPLLRGPWLCFGSIDGTDL